MDVKKHLIALGKNIQAAREAKMFQLPYMAHLCGISEEELAEIETGERDSDILTIMHIADTLDIDAGQLFDIPWSKKT